MESKLKEIKVDDLNDITLDFSMSKIFEVNIERFWTEDFIKSWEKGEFRYSSDYSLIGEIIESEKVQSSFFDENLESRKWVHTKYNENGKPTTGFGDTSLKSFCRCVVKSRFGDSVCIPEELL